MSSTTSPYPMVVYPDTCTDGVFCYVAEHPDLPGCAAHGTSITEARERLAGAREAYLAQLKAEGRPIPEPNSSAPTLLEWEIGLAFDSEVAQQP